eukprot:TRINITY_DN625_c0_g1_i1.p1 TRINITY_DN625_c0_g1~~TRINITY_DN625_c0_g1_i1.p1  ORF type:complete len:230 (+),score=22.82 TRINITY_DN625_c0_g1_i1:80-691(+)
MQPAVQIGEAVLKILLLGESGVGKSSLFSRFTTDQYTPSFMSTVGIDFKVQKTKIDGQLVKLLIYDTAGQERYRAIAESYYRGANGVLLCYDVTNRTSFERVQSWLMQLKNFAPPELIVILIANKTDLERERTISSQEGQDLATELGISYMETSAKSGLHVQDAFYSAVRQSLPYYVPGGPSQRAIVSPQPEPEPSRGCCTIM